LARSTRILTTPTLTTGHLLVIIDAEEKSDWTAFSIAATAVRSL
jgi:hypothetical protein